MADNNGSGNGKDKKQPDTENFYHSMSSGSNNHSHILIIDDEEVIRNSLSTILQREGFRVNAAADVETALEILQREPIDLVLADCQLKDPDDGLQLTQRIKNQFPKIIVVIISGIPSVDMAIQAMRFGAYDFFKKPYNTRELIGSIHAYLRKRQKALDHEQLIRSQLKSLYKTFLTPDSGITEETKVKSETALTTDIGESSLISEVIPLPRVTRKTRRKWLWVGITAVFVTIVAGIYLLNKPETIPVPSVSPDIVQTPAPLSRDEMKTISPAAPVSNRQSINTVLNTLSKAITSGDPKLYQTVFSTRVPDLEERISTLHGLWANYQIHNLLYVVSTEYPPEITDNQAILLVDWYIDLYQPSDQISLQRKETNLIRLEKENNQWKITYVSVR